MEQVDLKGRLGRMVEDEIGGIHMAYLNMDTLMYANNLSGGWETRIVY